MQILADVLERPIDICAAEETCALDAAMFAAGEHTDISTAQAAMGCGIRRSYTPVAANVAAYRQHYRRYAELAKCMELPGNHRK